MCLSVSEKEGEREVIFLLTLSPKTIYVPAFELSYNWAGVPPQWASNWGRKNKPLFLFCLFILFRSLSLSLSLSFFQFLFVRMKLFRVWVSLFISPLFLTNIFTI